jgi:hypothetical protein
MAAPEHKRPVPLRIGPYETLSFGDARPSSDLLRANALSKIPQGQTRVRLISESGTSIIISRPTEDHFGDLYKSTSRRGQVIPAADVLIEEFEVDILSGDLLSFKSALAIYPDLTLVRTHLGFPQEDNQGSVTMDETQGRNREAKIQDISYFTTLIEKAGPFDPELYSNV